MQANWLVRVNQQIFVLFGSAGFPLEWRFGVLWRKMDERGVCPWAEQWSALVVRLRRFVLGLIPTFRCADFSRELWRDCMVQHRWRCISAVAGSFFLLFTLVCTVMAIASARCC